MSETAQQQEYHSSEHAVATIEDGGLAPAEKRVWYRSPMAAAVILGLCNFCAPGLWGAMNSLGAGGEETPWLVNSANSLTFCLMILTAFLTSTITDAVGVNVAVFLGGIGFAPYCAGLYTNNVHGTEWLVLFGAATCGLSAGLFWGIEAAVALSYPEPSRMGKFLGIWLSFRVMGQIVGGAINLGLDANRSEHGAINPKVYIIFMTLTAAGPFLAFLLPRPHRVQRRDGLPVQLYTHTPVLANIKATARVLFTKEYLLIIPFIVQAVFPESYTNTYLASHFSVRVRALGSFVAAWACILVGNVTGWLLDRHSVPLKTRARAAFIFLVTTRGAWWVWSTVLEANFPTVETIDWTDKYFGRTFALYVFLGASFQTQYLFLYFIVQKIVRNKADSPRAAGLLRAVESASQAVAYGTSSIASFALLGSSSLNFGLWALAIVPTWLVVRRIGVDLWGPAEDKEVESSVATASEGGSVDEKR